MAIIETIKKGSNERMLKKMAKADRENALIVVFNDRRVFEFKITEGGDEKSENICYSSESYYLTNSDYY